jgi:hypothetical protein
MNLDPDVTIEAIQKQFEEIRSEEGRFTQVAHSNHPEEGQLYLYLAKFRDRLKELEDFCDKILVENHRLLNQVLSVARESDLRPLLAMQATVIDKLLKDRGREIDDAKSIMEFDKLTVNFFKCDKGTQTLGGGIEPRREEQVSPLKSYAHQYSKEVEREASLEVMRDSSFKEYGNQKRTRDLAPLYDQEGSPKLSKLSSVEDLNSIDLQKPGRGFANSRPQDISKKHNKSAMLLLAEFNGLKQDDLLDGSPFNDMHDIGLDNILFVEDMAPQKAMRKARTQQELEPVIQPPQIEESPLRKLLIGDGKEEVNVAGFDGLSKLKTGKTIQVPQFESPNGNQNFVEVENFTMLSHEEPDDPEDMRVKAYIGRMQKLKEYYTGKALAKDAITKTELNSPTINNAFKRRSSQKQIILPMKEATSKPSVFEDLNYKQFLRSRESPLDLIIDDQKPNKSYRKGGGETYQSTASHILRPKESKPAKQLLNIFTNNQKTLTKLEGGSKGLKKSPKNKQSTLKKDHLTFRDQQDIRRSGISSGKVGKADNSLDVPRTSLWPRSFNPFTDAEQTCDQFSRLKVTNYSFRIDR